MKRFPLTASSLLRESFEVVVGGIIDMYHLHKCCRAMAAMPFIPCEQILSTTRDSRCSSRSPQVDAELRPCTPKDMRHDLLHMYLPATDRELTTEICMIKNGSKSRFRHRFRKSLAD
jgi:hypothetical protein